MCIVELIASSLSALLPLVTAIIVTYVAWQQWRLSRDRFKLDLFEKRYKIYKTADIFLGSIAVTGDVKYTDAVKFLSDTQDAKFLFKPDIFDYINEIYKVSIEMESLNKRLQGVSPGLKLDKLVERKSEKQKWLTDQLTQFTEQFAPYLNLS